MADVIDLPREPTPDLLVGPFEQWRVVVDGRFIPNLTGWREGSEVWLCIDNRFAQRFPNEEVAYGAALLIAQGMAIASGYAHLGAETKDRAFAAKAMGIDLKK